MFKKTLNPKSSFLNLILKQFLILKSYILNLMYFPAYWLLRKFPFYRKLPLLAQRGVASLLTLLILLSSAWSYFYLLPSKIEAAWFDDSWSYRQRVDITNSGSAQTDYQVAITLDTSTLITAGKMQSDCDDIRITDTNGRLLYHWVEKLTSSACNTTTTKIWAKVPTISTSGDTLFVYYGNPSAATRENGKQTFVYFDDFTNGFDTNMWTEADPGDDIAVSSGQLAFVGGTGSWNQAVYMNTAVARGDMAMEFDYQWTSANASYDAFMMGWKDDGVGVSYANLVYAYYNISSDTCTSACPDMIYEDGSQKSANASGSWTQNTNYKVRVRTISAGGAYYDQSTDGGINFTNAYTSAYSTESSLHPGWTLHTGTHNIDNFFVRKDASTVPTIASPTNEEKAASPVGYWKFDDGTGTAAQDSTPNNNDGTLTNGPTWATEDQCIAGKCVYFDGTDDFVDTGNVGQDMGLNSATPSSFTIAAWFKPLPGGEDLGGIQMFATNSGPRIIYRTASKIFSMQMRPGETLTSTAAITEGQWNYLVGMYDATDNEIRIYLNGNFASETTPPSVDISTYAGNMRIGNAQGDFKGFIDEPKIYNYALTAAQIKANYTSRATESANVLGASDANENLSNGLVGYWKMDEASWTSDCATEEVLDASGNANNGESCPNADANDPVTGKYGNAGSFDGTNDYVSIDDATSLDLTDTVTVSAWIKRAVNGSSEEVIVNKGSDTYMIKLDASDRPTFGSYGVTDIARGSTAITSTSAWYHIVATKNGSTAKVYVNGVDETVDIASDTLGNNATALLIGSGTSSTYPFNGAIDEVRVYNRALSPAEVSQLYNFAPGPMLYYKMDEGSGTSTISDSSGNGTSGTLNTFAESAWTAGKYGKGLNFDGGSDYINTAPTLPTADFTYEAWVKPDSFSASPAIFGTDGANALVILFNTSGQLDVHTNGSDRLTSSAVTAGVWTHIAVTRQGSTIRVLINGDLSTSGTDGTALSFACDLMIGGERDSSCGGVTNAWDGSLDEIKIYNYARTEKQVVEDMNGGHPGVGSPVGSAFLHYKFDEGYGTSTNNLGNRGSALNGTLTNMASPATSTSGWTQSGKFNKALNFDRATDDYVDVPNLTGYKSDATTISVWFNPSELNNNKVYSFYSTADANGLDPDSGTHYRSQLRVNTDGTLFSHYHSYSGGCTANARNVTSTTTAAVGQWTHAVTVIEFTPVYKMTFYVNGVLQGTHEVAETCGSDLNFLWIGRRKGSSSNVNMLGAIDEFKMYNYALTADEVKLDMNQGAAQVLGTTGTSSTGSPDSSQAREYCVPGDSSTCNAPVGEWDFNEGTGTTANDKSGNGFTGTWQGTATNLWAPGKLGKGGNFNGSDNSVTVADNTTLDIGTSDFTISGWTKFNSIASSQFIVTKVDNASAAGAAGRNGYGIFYSSSGLICLKLYGNSTVTQDCATVSISTNRWYHIAVTADRDGNASFYLDGILITTGSISDMSTADLSDDDSFTLGSNNNTASWFNGAMDSVRVYTYVRSAAQVAWDFNRGAPIGWWKFDECQGTTAYDDSRNGNNATNGNHGTITIGATGTYTSAGTCSSGTSTHAWAGGVAGAGKRNYALSFDGDDNVNMTDPASGIFDFGTGDFSVSAWFKTSTDNASGYNSLITKAGTGTMDGWALAHDATGNGRGNQISFYVGDDVDEVISTTPTTFNDGNWHHVVGVRTSGTVYLYVDGVLRDSDTASAVNSVSTANNLVVGDRSAGSAAFIGQLDDARVYNYALNATQVKTLYNESAVFYGPVTGAP